MTELVWDDRFVKTLKKWRKKHPDLMGKFEESLSLFAASPFHSSLKTHSLTGNLKGYWALSITYEYRPVFRFLSENRVLLIDIGTHDEVY
ncbi:MAG: type II toxin-antitoxin system YafQ family toxin [Desulfococcaceae bacterium]